MSSFYQRPEWRELRFRVLMKQGRTCVACNLTAEDGARLHVDHIKPVSIYPELALTESNLQVLCEDCNLGKSNKYQDDLRRAPAPVTTAEPTPPMDPPNPGMLPYYRQWMVEAEEKGDKEGLRNALRCYRDYIRMLAQNGRGYYDSP